MQEITVAELKEWINTSRPYLLLDVREPYEHAQFNLGGLLLPLSELMNQKDQLPRDIPVVVYCEKGIRSIIAIQRLDQHGFTNLFNLKGGVKAWHLFGQD